MAGTLPPVIGVLLADTKQFMAKMGEAGVEMEALGKKGTGAFGQLASFGKAALIGLATVAVGVGVAAVDMASKFQTQMERLYTQAGVPQAAIKGLSNSVLGLAGQVATNPTSLAEALFHVMSAFQSTGITGANAMNILKVAAEGAKIGGANLVDTTNALDAAIVSGIRGAGDFNQAMGALNATVGAGDMTMQNLADALSNGVMPVVKNYGLSLLDVGSALATFGDNNIRGAVAGTALRMAVQAMAVPIKGGAKDLAAMGLTTKSMAEAMQNGGGLIPALEILKSHMEAAGITGDKVGQELTAIFGKRAGTGVAILYDQLDRLKSKYADISGGAKNFGEAWAQTQKTFSVEWGKLVATVEALGIKLGLWLIPIVEKVAVAISHAVTWLQKHKDVAIALGIAIGTVLVVAIGAYIASMIAAAAATIAATWEIIAVVAAVAAVAAGVYYAYTHWKWFHEAVQAVWAWLKGTLWPGLQAFAAWLPGAFQAALHAVETAWTAVVDYLKPLITDLVTWWKAHWDDIKTVLEVVWGVIKSIVTIDVAYVTSVISGAVKVISAIWRNVWNAIKDIVVIVWDNIKLVVMVGIHLVQTVIGVALDILNGHWSKAWKDLKTGVVNIFHDIVGFLGSVIPHMIDLGKNLILGLIHGIESMAGAAANAALNVAKSVMSSITGFLGIHSPSVKMAVEVGEPIIAGIAKGMTDNLARLSAASRASIPVITAPFSKGVAPLQVAALPSGAGSGSDGGSSINLSIALEIDGKTFATATTKYSYAELLRMKRGQVKLGLA